VLLVNVIVHWMGLTFHRLRTPVGLILLVAVGGCVTSPVGLIPALIADESTSYFLYAITPRITLSNGDVFGVGRVCSVSKDEASMQTAVMRLAATQGKECGRELGVFLRHGEHWQPLHFQNRERQAAWDEILLPEVFEDASTPTLLFVSAAWSRKDVRDGQLLRYTVGNDRVTLVLLAPDRKTMRKVALPPASGGSQDIHAGDSRRITVIFFGQTVYVLLRPNLAVKATWDEEITYPYSRERPEIDLGEDRTQIFVGNATHDGTMQQATHSRAFAESDPTRYVYFDGKLPVIGTDSLAVDDSVRGPAIPVICKYQWRGLEYAAGDHAHETSLEDCRQNTW
jgi:hypothetical protein